MNIRKTIATILLAAGTITGATASEPVTFAIASDFHAPDVPGGLERVKAFVDTARARGVDFIIELGDFARLDSASAPYHEAWNSFEGYRYHVIGNHDCDRYSSDGYAAGAGMPGRYYSFDKGGYHFVVLDGNNWADKEGNIHHYDHGNYYGKSTDWMDRDQLDWLRRDLASTDKRCILFSHQSIDFRLKNGEEVRRVLEEENRRAGRRKVVAAFSGHDHSNYNRRINGINYSQVNSASYVWIGTETQTERRFPKEINDRYSLMKYSMMYDRPLWAIVTLTDDGISIEGVKGQFMPPTPAEIGIKENVDGLPLVPLIEDYQIEL
ncbi:MAG: metallophosphoesterase family protein [Paramuribaculum sp.]|nr:metallophosphoesterase family protein [Paramuribaculum sp.]